MLCHVAGSFIGGFLKKLNPVDTSVSTWINNRIVANIQGIITEGVNIPVTDDKTLLDAVNYIYQSHLGGEDNGNYPDWARQDQKRRDPRSAALYRQEVRLRRRGLGREVR